MKLAIFAKKAFRLRPDGHLGRVSSIIRGEQIANYLGAKLNPEKVFKNDVCIYVKPHIKPGGEFNFAGKPYLDIIDGVLLKEILKKHPGVPAIACSEWDVKFLSGIINNKIVLIPQQHCNFERIKRNRQGITAVGCIGGPGAFGWLPRGLKQRLGEMGIELVEFSRFLTRQDVVDFYQKIDVQIVWRPFVKYLSNPLKIVNAAAFGVPTIALREVAFGEMGDSYIPVNSEREFVEQLKKLMADSGLYDEYAYKCLEKARQYHIEKVAKLYLQL